MVNGEILSDSNNQCLTRCEDVWDSDGNDRDDVCSKNDCGFDITKDCKTCKQVVNSFVDDYENVNFNK